MIQEQIAIARSLESQKAFALGNNQNPTFLVPTKDIAVTTVTPKGDGIYTGGAGDCFVPNGVIFWPYAEGAVSSSFSVRLWAWYALFAGQAQGGPTKVWYPSLLCEVACVSCAMNGSVPAITPPPPNLLIDSERFCDTISLTQGSLGAAIGEIVATGSQPAAETDIPGFVICQLRGARMIQWDFSRTEPTDSVNMNCLWSFF